MKRVKFIGTIMMAFFCIFLSMSVSASPKISNKTLTLISGQKKQIRVLGTKKKVKWYSSNKNVATVNSSGKVTAKRKGNTIITAKISEKKYICKISVETPSISKKSISINKGVKYTLKINGTNQKVSWKSSKKSVASITSGGIVVANGYGKATITAYVGGKKYKCIVSVNRPPAYLSDKYRTIYEGQSFDLQLNNSNAKVSWSTGNKKIATIKKISTYKYRITGKKSGTVKITVKSGSKKYTCKVTVKEKPRELFPGKKDCGFGTFYIYFESGTSQGGKVPIVYVDRKFKMGYVSYHAFDVNSEVPIRVYIDAKQVDAQYVPYSFQASVLFSDDKMSPGTHVVEMVQYENNNPNGNIITYRKAKYKVVYK